MGARSSMGQFVGLAAAIYASLCLLIFVTIRHLTGGHFFFSLDDPYIHLALAEQIARGTYGINAGEFGSPSSSILWPLLLFPFSRLTWQPMIALGINFLAGLGSAAVLGRIVALWSKDEGGWGERLRQIVSIIALIFIANLVALTFVGMEHTLQIFLTIVCAAGLIEYLSGRPLPVWCFAAAAVLPLVRYEGIGITLAVAIALWGRRKKAEALGLMAAAVAPLVAFSLFLRHLGLPLLPVSVMIKGGINVDKGDTLHHLVLLVASDLYQALSDPDHIVLLILFLSLCGFAWQEKDRARRFALAGAAIAAGLHLLIGRFNWFHRYEIYIVIFGVLLVLHVIQERAPIPLAWYCMGLAACCMSSIVALRQTPHAAQDVYLQQYQMHRFATDFYTGNVAVNDLGLVSYHRREGEYVLDLFGLGSAEVARTKIRSPEWMDQITREHHIGVVMAYPAWIGGPLPGWTPLGALCLDHAPVVLWSGCVSYYATPAASMEATKAQFQAFVKTLPPGIMVTMGQ